MAIAHEIERQSILVIVNEVLVKCKIRYSCERSN